MPPPDSRQGIGEPHRPPEPTATQLTYGLRLIRIAIAGSILFIVAFTAAFLLLTDIPVIPLLPVAVMVILLDIGFVIFFSRSRKEQIRRAELRDAGVDPPDPTPPG